MILNTWLCIKGVKHWMHWQNFPYWNLTVYTTVPKTSTERLKKFYSHYLYTTFLNKKASRDFPKLRDSRLISCQRREWSASGTVNSGITYNNGVAFTRDSNVNLFGMYQQTITWKLVGIPYYLCRWRKKRKGQEILSWVYQEKAI